METNPQTKRAFRTGVLLSCAIAALLAVALHFTSAGEWLESGTFDARARWTAQPEKADSRIVIIDIDNASFDTLQEKLGRWPWPRQVWTEVLRHVTKGEPAAVAFDAVFSGAQNEAPQMDADFAEMLKRSQKTVLGFSFVATQLDSTNTKNVTEGCVPAKAAGFPLACGFETDKWVANFPLQQLADSAAGLGSVNSTPDERGVIRHEPLAIAYGGKAFATLGEKTFEVATSSRANWNETRNWLGSHFLEQGAARIPVDKSGRVLLLWRGDSLHSYTRVPLWEVICSIYPEQCPNAEHHFPPEYFHNKVVLVGASAAGSYEARPTPMNPQAPGFVAHATLIDNLLNGEAMQELPAWFAVAMILLLTAVGGFAQWSWRSFRIGGALIALVLLAYFGGSLLLFRGPHVVLPLVAPCFALVASYGGASAARYVTTGRELRQTRGMMERYMAPQLVNYMMDDLNHLRLNGDRRELTILISDVRNFTTMSEKADPMELIALLNAYLEAMTEIIFKHNGIVDKFIGDGILAYWGAFTPGQNHAEQAARAGLEMMEKLKELNAHWVSQGKNPIAIGMGINTGAVIFGNIGKGKKIEFTVIGDPVNLAARLEGLNKEFHTSVIVSETTKERLGPGARLRALGGVKVKGKTVETIVYELQGWDAEPAVATEAAAQQPETV